jgi:hypothetical protein
VHVATGVRQNTINLTGVLTLDEPTNVVLDCPERTILDGVISVRGNFEAIRVESLREATPPDRG